MGKNQRFSRQNIRISYQRWIKTYVESELRGFRSYNYENVFSTLLLLGFSWICSFKDTKQKPFPSLSLPLNYSRSLQNITSHPWRKISTVITLIPIKVHYCKHPRSKTDAQRFPSTILLFIYLSKRKHLFVFRKNQNL